MNGKKLLGIILLIVLAVAFTILYNERFPKYGNTYDNIAQIATRRDIFSHLVFGSDVKVCDVVDYDTYRFAVLEPLDENEKQYGYIYFRKNPSGKYESRGEVVWISDDKIYVTRLDTDSVSYDIIVHNNSSVILAQRTDRTGHIETMRFPEGRKISLWESSEYGFIYACVTSDGCLIEQH